MPAKRLLLVAVAAADDQAILPRGARTDCGDAGVTTGRAGGVRAQALELATEYDVGLPGKSGIGGGIVTVARGEGGLATFAPRLDEAGNSVRGQLAAGLLSRALGLDIFMSRAEDRRTDT
jgi:Glutaminase